MELEKMLEELKNITKKLEDNQLSLDESLKLYQQGLELCKNSQEELENLKLKIQLLNNQFEPIDEGDIENE